MQKYGPGGVAQPFNPGVTISYPSGLYIDSQDMVYVTDLGVPNGSARIMVFDPTGNLVTETGEVADLAFEEYRDVAVDEQNQIIYVVTNNFVAKFDMNGNYQSSWTDNFRAYGIAVGSAGQVFLADTYNNRIDQYDTDGNLQGTLADGQLYRPYHVAVDAQGRLLIADYRNNQILMYQ